MEHGASRDRSPRPEKAEGGTASSTASPAGLKLARTITSRRRQSVSVIDKSPSVAQAQATPEAGAVTPGTEDGQFSFGNQALVEARLDLLEKTVMKVQTEMQQHGAKLARLKGGTDGSSSAGDPLSGNRLGVPASFDTPGSLDCQQPGPPNFSKLPVPQDHRWSSKDSGAESAQLHTPGAVDVRFKMLERRIEEAATQAALEVQVGRLQAKMAEVEGLLEEVKSDPAQLTWFSGFLRNVRVDQVVRHPSVMACLQGLVQKAVAGRPDGEAAPAPDREPWPFAGGSLEGLEQRIEACEGSLGKIRSDPAELEWLEDFLRGVKLDDVFRHPGVAMALREAVQSGPTKLDERLAEPPRVLPERARAWDS